MMKLSGCLLLLTLMLTACGGGGSGGSGPVTQPPPSSQAASSLVSSSQLSSNQLSSSQSSSDQASSLSQVSSLSSTISQSSLAPVSSSSQVSSVSSSSSSRASSQASSSLVSVPSSSSSSRSQSSQSSSANSSVSSSSLSSSSAAQSSSSSSATSSSVSSSSQVSSLATPQGVLVSYGNQSLTLTWNPVANASGYHLYYSTDPNFTIANYAAYANGTWLQNVTSPRVISGLVNGQTYYLAVTAFNGSIESVASARVSATPTAPVAATPPSPQEVLALELINRARFDPAAEAQRYSIGLNDGGVSISPNRKPPLVHNAILVKAARGHSQWMIDNDIFDHVGENGSSPTQRITAAGYVLSGSWTTGENIVWRGTGGSTINLTDSIRQHHELLFRSAGHRVNMLNAGFREAGMGQIQGHFRHTDGINYLSSMLTQKFARSGSAYFLTGVVYQDGNSNNFYDPGEALAGVTINVNGQNHSPYASGAYAIPLSNGNYTVSISGGGLGVVDPVAIQVNNGNVKLDVIRQGSNVEVVTWQ